MGSAVDFAGFQEHGCVSKGPLGAVDGIGSII